MSTLLQNNLIIINLVITIILISIAIIQILINKKTKKDLQTYIETLEKINKYDNTGEAFNNIYKNLEKTNNFCEVTKQRCEETELKLQKSIQKIGFMKYSTHDTGKNELSFSIAMLDNNNDGIILNQVNTRNTSNIYAKQIEDGKSKIRLSLEEEKVLKDAVNDKDYVKRKNV